MRLPEGSWITSFINLVLKGASCLNSSVLRVCICCQQLHGLDYGLCPRELCSFIWRPLASSRSMGETWRLWLWKWSASAGGGGLSYPSCHCQRCGLWKLLHWIPGVQTAPRSKELRVCGLQPMLPSLWALPPRLFWWLRGWFSFLASYCDCRHGKIRDDLQNRCQSPISLRDQTHCCLGMVLERKRNFSLFVHSQS